MGKMLTVILIFAALRLLFNGNGKKRAVIEAIDELIDKTSNN